MGIAVGGFIIHVVRAVSKIVTFFEELKASMEKGVQQWDYFSEKFTFLFESLENWVKTVPKEDEIIVGIRKHRTKDKLG